MEKSIIITNRSGDKLFGIVHIPEISFPTGKRVGINLLNPGIKYRVAPNRLNIKLARNLCEKGYYVLRFDPAGIGDSEGELPDGVLVLDIGEEIMKGIFVNDTIDANDFFIESFKLNKLVLAGSCGGAITSLLTSKEDKRVDALCLIDIPIALRTSRMTFAHKLADGGKRIDKLFWGYLKKIFSLKSWFRFITFKTDFRALWKIINMEFKKKLLSFSKNHKFSKDMEELCREKNLNKMFFDSFEAYNQKNNPILFALAENYSGTEVFQEYFLNLYQKKNGRNIENEDLVDVYVIKDANHTYTFSEWQEELTNRVNSWLDTQVEH